jgi:hypothetical protein
MVGIINLLLAMIGSEACSFVTFEHFHRVLLYV